MSSVEKNITVVGAGLAGSEAALVLSRILNHYCSHYGKSVNAHKYNIELVEMRPNTNTPVHTTDMPAELVCSNSFKSMKPNSAAGMLKRELEQLDSPVYNCALNTKVDAGGALAVDRVMFSKEVANKIMQAPNINYCQREVTSVENELQNADIVILATGPMTSDVLAENLGHITGEKHLAFYDAAAPIVEADTIDYDIVFSQDRYGKSDDDSSSMPEGSKQIGDYLNCPMNKEEYELFINELLKADTVIKKAFETKELFSACQPVEEIARRGFDAPRFGALKPVGLIDPRTGERPYAVVQLRSENENNTAYNLVGFQTNLTFGEQKRIFRLIPGLGNAEFSRYGVMHRNTFVNSPKLLNRQLELTVGSIDGKHPNKDNAKALYIAGQLSGTEGYLEAVRSGHHAALCAAAKILNIKAPVPSTHTVFGALLDYATNPDTVTYQPMHVNFGILPPLDQRERNKQQRYTKYAQRGEEAMIQYVEHLKNQKLLE